MLVIYDQNGMINQCIIQADCTLEVLAERYQAMGISHILHDGEADILNAYVSGGQVLLKPAMQITGNNRPVKADGVDVLEFLIDPVSFNATVTFQESVVHQEAVTDGKLDFTTAQAGTYKVYIEAPFPYQPTILTIEAV